MAYDRDDDRYGDSRWRDRDRFSERSGFDRDRDYRGAADYGRGRGRQGDDRGFFDRAGDEVRSWFRDDDASPRHDRDHHRRDREQRMSGDRDNDYGRSGGMARGSQRGRSDGGRFVSDEDAPGGYGYGFGGSGSGGGMGAGYNRDFGPGASGFGDAGGNDDSRRFDLIDAGSTGGHGAHPYSAPIGGSTYGQPGTYGEGSRWQHDDDHLVRGGGDRARTVGRGRHVHDPHYSEWRVRQIEALDRDYDEYRREHQSRFEQEFGTWRQRREGQRQSLGRVSEHMVVVGSDGERVGTVDKVRGDRIILTKSDETAGGRHHSIPCSWIENVDEKVTINKKASEAMRSWEDEDRNRALFERDDQRSEGPHMLNRSFSGTYDKNR